MHANKPNVVLMLADNLGYGNNRIKTIPNKGFCIYYRIFGPEADFFDGSWKLDYVFKAEAN